jgi:hypothetical protein
VPRDGRTAALDGRLAARHATRALRDTARSSIRGDSSARLRCGVPVSTDRVRGLACVVALGRAEWGWKRQLIAAQLAPITERWQIEVVDHGGDGAAQSIVVEKAARQRRERARTEWDTHTHQSHTPNTATAETQTRSPRGRIPSAHTHMRETPNAHHHAET